MSTWTIQCTSGTVTTETELSELGLQLGQRHQVNQGSDTLAVSQKGVSSFEAPLFPYGSTVTIRKDGVTYFLGYVHEPVHAGSGSDEGIEYPLEGPWYWLRKIVYEQQWRVYNVAGEQLEDAPKSRVILNQGSDGASVDVGDQITDAVNWAAAEKSAPIQIGSVPGSLTLPFDEQVDWFCADVIIKSLRMLTNYSTWVDYTTSPPTLNVTSRAVATAVNIDLTADTTGDYRCVRRRDLELPGLTLRFETTHDSDDGTYETLTIQEAGDTDAIEAMVHTIELAGSRVSYLSQEIEVSAWPDDLNDKDWWRSWCPGLADYDDADIDIANTARSGDHPDLDRILIFGEVQEWMDEEAAEEEVTGTVTLRTKDPADNAVVNQSTTKKTFTVTATDARTKTYSHLSSGEWAEDPPVNMANAIYTAMSQPMYDGVVEVHNDEVLATLRPGKVINLTNGRAEWASMRALIQSVTEDPFSGRTTIQFGWPRQLGIDDLVTQLRAMRGRRPSYNYRARTTGESKDKGNAVENGGTGTKEKVDGEDPLVEKLVIRVKDEEGAATHEIRNDPSLATTDGYSMTTVTESGKKVMKPDWLRWRNIA